MHVIVFVPPLLLPPTIATQIPLGLPILQPSVKFSHLVSSLSPTVYRASDLLFTILSER